MYNVDDFIYIVVVVDLSIDSLLHENTQQKRAEQRQNY